MKSRTLSEAEVRQTVHDRVVRAGSMRAAAREFGVTVSYVSDLLNGRRAPGPKILGPLGLERIKMVVYRRKEVRK